MGPFLKKIILFSALLLVAALIVDPMLTAIHRKGRTVKAQWLNNMHGRHYDLAILGSSRAWWNIDMHLINEQCGVRSINMANNHFTFSEQLLALKMFLARDNSIGHLLIQVDPHNMRAEQDQFSSTVYDYLPWLKEPMVYEHLRPRSNEWQLLRHVPAARYVKYNFRWGPEEVLVTLLDRRNTIFDTTGSFFMDRAYRGWPYIEITDGTYVMNEDLRQILALCSTEGIRYDLFTAPYYRLRMPAELRAEYEGMLQRNDLLVHDWSNLLDSTAYFDNNWHLSLEGGRIFTRHMIEDLLCPGRPDNNGRRLSVP
jgi:hypothetical protein